MRLPTDSGTWGIVLAILAIVLMYPVGLLINLTTPLVQNWIVTRSKASLINRIAKLENQLVELEKTPVITDVENYLLWGQQRIQITVFGAVGVLTTVVYFGIRSLSDITSSQFKAFTKLAMVALFVDLVLQLRSRYEHNFRYTRSPERRRRLRTAIEDLKKIRDSWP